MRVFLERADRNQRLAAIELLPLLRAAIGA
jgi:hypothetical protein